MFFCYTSILPLVKKGNIGQKLDNQYPQKLDNQYPKKLDNQYPKKLDNQYPQKLDNQYPKKGKYEVVLKFSKILNQV